MRKALLQCLSQSLLCLIRPRFMHTWEWGIRDKFPGLNAGQNVT